MRTALNLSPLRKLCSKSAPSRMLRSFALITAPDRASLMCSTFTMASSLPSISNAVPTRKSFVSINQVLRCWVDGGGPGSPLRDLYIVAEDRGDHVGDHSFG